MGTVGGGGGGIGVGTFCEWWQLEAKIPWENRQLRVRSSNLTSDVTFEVIWRPIGP